MSENVTTELSAPPPTRTARTTAGRIVARRASRLQDALLHGGAAEQARARALLARLRQNVDTEPEAVAAIWEVTSVPTAAPVRTDDATVDERATHIAMTLFGVHQQSRPDGMHREGRGLGAAVRVLATGGNEQAVRRRFDAIASAQTLSEAAYHLRGLITQLRGASIALDYGLLADDLVGLHYPTQTARVRRRWARDYYRLIDAPTTVDGPTPLTQTDSDQPKES